MFYYYKEALIRLFYPAVCEICQTSLDLEEQVLCGPCAKNLDTLAWSMEKTLIEERFESLDHIWAVYAYDSPIRELLHSVKYARKDYLLKACKDRALSLAQAITSGFGYDAILPIPIDRLKLMQRHFNQAEILARLLKPGLALPVEKSLLIKPRAIPSQTSLDKHERAINIYGAFKLKRHTRVRNGSFLLLDDVLTTGATANEAARLLKLHGARRVGLLALARTVTEIERTHLLGPAER